MKQVNDSEIGSLFEMKNQFRIVELRDVAARKRTDDFAILQQLITANEAMYPSIESWFRNKVVPGLKSSERVAYVAYENHKAIASAVLKLGDRAKFCHLRIHQDFQDLDLGQMFFTQMTLEARHFAKEIHFTLPESLWDSKRHFFESFGFSSIVKASRQYRRGEEELSCSAPLKIVWSSALQRLPKLLTKFFVGGYSLENNLLMSIKPKYANMLLGGSKLVEIRRRFSEKWVGCRVVLYASGPVSSLVGEARISSVVFGKPSDIWLEFKTKLGCSWDEFSDYASSAEQVSAIELTDITPYKAPVPLSQVSHLVNENLRPPQSYCDLRLEQDSPWAKAVSVATLLHGRFAFSR